MSLPQSFLDSTGLSSLLAGDVSPPPKNDARGLFKSYRERSTSAQEAGLRATKTQETYADPTSPGRFSRPQVDVGGNQSNRHSMPSFPAATAGVKMRYYSIVEHYGASSRRFRSPCFFNFEAYSRACYAHYQSRSQSLQRKTGSGNEIGPLIRTLTINRCQIEENYGLIELHRSMKFRNHC